MNFEYIDKIRQKSGISIDISEFHGNISACLCSENMTVEALLPEEIKSDESSLSSETMKLKTVFLSLIAETLEQLNDTEMSFYLLLSPDSEPLTDRTLSLSIGRQPEHIQPLPYKPTLPRLHS